MSDVLGDIMAFADMIFIKNYWIGIIIGLVVIGFYLILRWATGV